MKFTISDSHKIYPPPSSRATGGWPPAPTSVGWRVTQVSATEIARLTRGRRVGADRYLGHCPNGAVHKRGDRNPSLSIRQLSDRVVLKCFACDDTPAILRALNVTFAHISPPLPDQRVRFHASRFQSPLPIDWQAEWKRMPRRLARTAVEGPPAPETHEQRLKLDCRVLATNVRILHRLIEEEPVLWGDAIPQLAEQERELDEIHAALCGPKPFIYDATRGGGR